MSNSDEQAGEAGAGERSTVLVDLVAETARDPAPLIAATLDHDRYPRLAPELPRASGVDHPNQRPRFPGAS